MAKINLSFDTKEKTLTATLDGKEVPNLKAAYFYNRYDDENKFYAELVTVDSSSDDIRYEQRICSEEDKDKKKKKKKWGY